ncbi:MAG: host attachment family protein [Ruegeria sp.]|nr:host attachment family protein [Ruegeria sp.]
MVALEQGTWIVISDGEKALFVENITDAEDASLVVVPLEERDTLARRTDQAEQGMDTGSHQKPVMEEPNWKIHAKSLFVQDVANLLNRNGLKGAFNKLVLVASPHVLGLLRRRLHSDVLAKVVAEVDKTLTNHPLHKVENLLKSRPGLTV